MKPKRFCMAASVSAACVIAALAAQPAQAQTFKVLFSFNVADGANPNAGLIQDSKGNFYGTTVNGGAYSNGVVFKLSKTGQETVLYNFCIQKNCADGSSSYGGLILDAEDNLYGTTYNGGTGTDCYDLYGIPGCGTVFKLSKTGKETVLHSFKGGSDGELPFAGVIRDKEGNLYGTTWLGGGSGDCNGYPCGTVFRVSKTGKETVLHSFRHTDGDEPLAGVILDVKGKLYGTTEYGGLTALERCSSSVRRASSSPSCTHSQGGEGCCPSYGSLLMDAKGNLYGTAAGRGAYDYGTVFELSKTGAIDSAV